MSSVAKFNQEDRFNVVVEWSARDCDGATNRRNNYTLNESEIERLIGQYVMSAHNVEVSTDEHNWHCVFTGASNEEGYSNHSISYKIMEECE